MKFEHIFTLPLRWGLSVWQRLVEPPPSVQGEDERSQSRLLASLLLSVMIAVLLLAPVPLLVNHFPPLQDPQFIATMFAAIFMFMAYQFNRLGYYRIANAVTIIYGTIAIFTTSILVGGTSGVNGLYYLLTLVVFSSLFLTLKVSAVVIVVHTLGILLLAVVRTSVSFSELLIGPLSFNLFMGCIIMLVAYHWKRAQMERQAKLAAGEERYRIISELMSDYAFCFRVEPDERFTLEWITDAAFTGLAEHTPHDARLGGIFAFPSGERDQVRQEWKRILQGESVDSEHRITTQKGETRWIHLHRQPMWDDQLKRVTRFYGVVEDITERKQAEIALRESEERYRMISETISDYAFSFSVAHDKTIKLEWVTDSISQVAGYLPDELQALTERELYALYHPEDRWHVEQDFENLIAGGSTEGDYRIIAKNGDVRWVYIYRRPIWDEEEKRVVRFFGVAEDITERKQAESALRQSEERYRAISELISDYAFSCVVTEDGKLPLDWITDSVVHVTGYSAEEVRTLPDFSCIHPDDDNRARADVGKVLNGTVTDSEYRFITKSGDNRWMRMYRRPVWSEKENRVARFYAVVEDITERKQAEEALRQSEERYRIISEMISDYAFSVLVEPDGALECEWITDSVRNVTGYTPREFVQKGNYSLYHDEDRALARSDVEKVLRGIPTSNEYRTIAKNGEVRWLHMYRRPIWDEGNKRVMRYYVVAQDITERKQMEAQKMRLALEQERMTMVGQFLQAFSHDVRTSLATIETSRYLIERLSAEVQPKGLQTQLNKIHYSVNHLAEQLNNLHMISSLSDPKPIPCQLNRMIESLVAEHSLRARQKNQVLVFVADGSLATIPADEVKLRQAIQHLLLNALAHTDEGGHITLRTRQDDRQIVVEVQDTGIGIEPEKLSHIFEPFYKTDLSRTLEAGGMGLGLSIVNMIVEAHGGRISVESQPGRGSIFTISLPVPSKSETVSPETQQLA